MAEKPILFSAPMVRAILGGRKTQTRRTSGIVVQFHGVLSSEEQESLELENHLFQVGKEEFVVLSKPFRICPGDLLWVREAWAPIGEWIECTGPEDILYRATATEAAEALTRWRPSIHMPKWASRITLRVTGVKVERLQDISEADAKAEGVLSYPHHWDSTEWPFDEIAYEGFKGAEYRHTHAKPAFKDLWENINGPGSWDANPWVAAISFERVK